MASDISYDYVQVKYSAISSDDVDADGIYLDGSFGVAPNVALTAGVGKRTYEEVFGVEVEDTEFHIGLTGYTSIAKNTDVFGNFSILKMDYEIDFGFGTVSDDDTGNRIRLGVRHLAGQEFELEASYVRIDIFDDTFNAIDLGARLHANRRFSVGLGYLNGEDDYDAVSLDARFGF